MMQLSPVTASDNLRKKALDREVPYHMIPRQDLGLYEEADRKEWKSWQDQECVEVVPPTKAKEVLKRVPRSRLIRLRFVYRDKKTALRIAQTPLPVRAKARLCTRISRTLGHARNIEFDSPTVRQTGLMVFLQLVATFGWHAHWRKGDITAASLQGRQRDESTLGELYLAPPPRPL